MLQSDSASENSKIKFGNRKQKIIKKIAKKWDK